MPQTRVALGAMPPLVRDLVRETVSAHPDLLIVAEIAESGEVSHRLAETGAEVLVQERGLGPDLRELFSHMPSLRVLSIEPDGRTAELCELAPACQTIEAIGVADLIEALRGVRAHAPAAGGPSDSVGGGGEGPGRGRAGTI